LSIEDIHKDCIYNMRVDGSPVRASRLFMGNEYKNQMKYLAAHFNVPFDYHKTVLFDADIFSEIIKDFEYMFRWVSISNFNMPEETKFTYDCYEHAYHQLMIELVMLQVESINTVSGNKKIKQLYVDGGFSDNDVYIKLLSQYLRNMNLRTAGSSLGSAFGAAIAISGTKLGSKFLKKNYGLKKQVAIIAQ